MMSTINPDRGPWAVALVGYRGWDRDMAIGDGITQALNALVSRHATKEEAEAAAKALNDSQPAVWPRAARVRGGWLVLLTSTKRSTDD